MAFWTVAKTNGTKTYYISTVNKAGQIVWTPKRAECLKFETQDAATNYVRNHLKNRSDVYFVCVTPTYPWPRSS